MIQKYVFFCSRYLFFKQKTVSKQFKNSMYFFVVVVLLNLQYVFSDFNRKAEKRKFSDGKTYFGRKNFRTKKNPKVFPSESFRSYNVVIKCLYE